MKPNMDELLPHNRDASPVLPQWAIRPLAAIVITAGALGPFLPEGHWSRTASAAIVAVGAGFGIMSQGVWR